MGTLFGSALRLMLTPSLADVTFARRRFPGEPTAVTDQLERVPQSVICGFEWGIDSGSVQEMERRLDMMEPELRGYGYEGATMACTVRDSLAGHRTRDLLRGPGQPHLFVAFIGIGFAMARLPRPLWKKVVPDLAGTPYFPTISWLAVDGYAFDRAYFDTRRWVDEQHLPPAYPWAGHPEYFPRAVDQGIGRALWFIHGARVPDVTGAVLRFPPQRQADLWSGVGLAAAFAGGSDHGGLTTLREAAQTHGIELGLGAVLAAMARNYAGFVPGHTVAATAALSGCTIDEAVAIADRSSAVGEVTGPVTSYEVWRQRIRAQLAQQFLVHDGALRG